MARHMQTHLLNGQVGSLSSAQFFCKLEWIFGIIISACVFRDSTPEKSNLVVLVYATTEAEKRQSTHISTNMERM